MNSANLIPRGRSLESENQRRAEFLDLFRSAPIPDNEVLMNLGLFTRRQLLARILFMHEMYQKILTVQGSVIEFGVRWGQNLALFENFRGMYEPHNYTRKMIGFDSFAGFPAVHEKDAAKRDNSPDMKAGAFAVTPEYELFLERILSFHEQENPISHIQKFELVKGDASITVPQYFKDHPETIVALAYFDFDIYEPTYKSLEILMKHVTKGSVIGFDQLNHPAYPGETVALKEVLGCDRYRIVRSPLTPTTSYLVID